MTVGDDGLTDDKREEYARRASARQPSLQGRRAIQRVQPSQPDRWGTMEDAAAEIKVDRATIRRMITRGEIEAKRFGPRLIRVNISSLLRAGRDLQWRGFDE